MRRFLCRTVMLLYGYGVSYPVFDVAPLGTMLVKRVFSPNTYFFTNVPGSSHTSSYMSGHHLATLCGGSWAQAWREI